LSALTTPSGSAIASDQRAIRAPRLRSLAEMIQDAAQRTGVFFENETFLRQFGDLAAALKDLKAAFQAAAAAAKQTKKKPDNATLLKLYSYYKQASEGDASGDRPGGFDFVGGAKYDAWSKLKGMSKDDAMQNYIKQVEKLNRD